MATFLSEGALIDVKHEVPIFSDCLISPALEPNESIDEDGVGTIFHLSSDLLGGFAPVERIYIPVGTFGTTTTGLPETADPPFPPVYPYLFSTDELYGREHMNQILRMIRGDRYTFELAVILDGEAFNLSGYKLWMTAKYDIYDADAAAVFQITSDDDISITDAVNGLATVTVKPAKTVNLPTHEVRLPYDIQAVDEADATKVYTVLRGTLVVSPDATITTS